jgi:hypothetical protein
MKPESMNDFAEIKWDALQRLEEIERWLFWQGSLSRTELALKFRMSKQQTSAILKHYQQLNPLKMKLNGSTKRYLPDDSVANLFYQPNLTDLLMQAEPLDIAFVDFAIPSRRFPIEIARDLARAIYQQQSLEIKYHSQKDPAGLTRRITPHSFVNTSKRVHVRAWCHDAQDYRDFIVGRITETRSFDSPGKGLNEDQAWHHEVALKLTPNPRLNAGQKKLIELDFDMIQGIHTLSVRQAMLPYYMELYTLWADHQITEPSYQPVVLANPADVLKYL